MGKLFVMVFEAPCSHDKSCQNLYPDTRTYPLTGIGLTRWDLLVSRICKRI